MAETAFPHRFAHALIFSLDRLPRRTQLSEDHPEDSLSGFFAGVLVAASAEGFAAVSFGEVDFSPAVEVTGDSFLAASLYESLR